MRTLSHKHEDQWAEFCIVHSSPHWATQGLLTVPSHPSRQTTSSLFSHTSYLTDRGVISDSQGTPLDSEHNAEKEKAAQVK